MSNYAHHPLEGVAERRRLLKIRLKDLASAIGVQPTSLSRFERGERRIYLDKAHTLARMLECSIEDLGRIPEGEEAARLFQRGEQLRKLSSMSDEDREAQTVLAEWAAEDEAQQPRTPPVQPAPAYQVPSVEEALATWNDLDEPSQ
jgi:transcriptional regulator with XRE-family HTH domain